MLKTIKEWFGFGGQDQHIGHGHEHHHGGATGHGHTHGIMDPGLSSSERGVWAIKWSFIILAITSVLQLGVVLTSGSVALLADTIHNIGDATTAPSRCGWPSSLCAESRPRGSITASAAWRTWRGS